MGKRRVLSGREVCRLLEANGFIKVRQRGSHVAMQKRAEGVTITIPVPGHDELKPGTLASIIRQSGLDKRVFESE